MSDSRKAFKLRKDGKLDEALALSRKLIERSPNDPWVIRAYGWCLYDAVKRAERSGNRATALELMVEFNKLQIPEGDELLLKQRAHYQITLLGSETHLAEGLRKARQRIRDYPNDPKAIKDYGWILCDGVTHALNIRNTELAQKLAIELQPLAVKVPVTEEALRGKIQWCLGVAGSSGGGSLLIKAKRASKEGHRQQALELYRQAYAEGITVESAMGVAWELYKSLKVLSPKQNADLKVAAGFLQEYARLDQTMIEKPSIIHSLMLSQMAKFSEANQAHLACLKAVDADKFRDEDFERYHPKNGSRDYDGVVEKVVKSVYYAAKTFKSMTHEINGSTTPGHKYLSWAAEYVGRYYDCFPRQEWFPYYYGKLLIMTGDLKAAREHILETVRRKRNEFWAWDNLASTFSDDEQEKKIACLCRALLCHVPEPIFLVNVRTKLAKCMVELGKLDAARVEIAEVIRARSGKNKGMAPGLQKLLKPAQWHGVESVSGDNKALYREKAADIEMLLFGKSAWTAAVITGFAPPNDDRPGLVFIGFMAGKELKQIPVKEGSYAELKGCKKGDPLNIVIESRSGRNVVVLVKAREGPPWDTIPFQVGVVKHVNNDRRITSVILSKDSFCLIPHDRFPDAKSLTVGDAVAIRTRQDGKRDRLMPLTVERTDETPSSDFVRQFSGKLRLQEDRRFGFVDNIYIARSLLSDPRIGDGASVEGQAVCEWNDRKNTFSWSALIIQLMET